MDNSQIREQHTSAGGHVADMPTPLWHRRAVLVAQVEDMRSDPVLLLRRANHKSRRRTPLFRADPVHLPAEGYGAFLRDLVSRLDPDAIELRMAEETHVHAHGHARLENIIAVRTEER